MERKTYHVVKEEDGWKGTVEGASRASVTGDNKAEVVKETIDLAKSQPNTQVVIHKENGQIQEERTYGDDPHPPIG